MVPRQRRQLVGEKARERNRIQKILEDANIKLGAVLSDVLALSGRLMINALLEGVLQAVEIAQFAQGKAKQKIPDLMAALRRNRLACLHDDGTGLSTEWSRRRPLPGQRAATWTHDSFR